MHELTVNVERLKLERHLFNDIQQVFAVGFLYITALIDILCRATR